MGHASCRSPRAADQAMLLEEVDLEGGTTSPIVASDGGPEAWLAGEVRAAALSMCFVDELVERSCRIAVEVRHGRIAVATVEPFEGASRRVIARSVEEEPRALAPHELLRWLAAGEVIDAVRDEPQLADRDKLMQVGDILAASAKARLEGVPVSGPDGRRWLRFGWRQDPPTKIDAQAYEELEVARGMSRGSPGAPTTVVTFLDVACRWQFSGKSFAAWCEVLAQYPGEVRLVVKLCPLEPEHALAAEAIYAAGSQWAFWPMLELLGARRDCLSLDDLVRHASTLGLDTARFRTDLEQGTFREEVDRDLGHQLAMDIDALPSAIINGKHCVHGALPASSNARAIERVRSLQASGSPSRPP